MPFSVHLDGQILRVSLYGGFVPLELWNVMAEVSAIERASAEVPDRIIDLSGLTEGTTIRHEEMMEAARQRRGHELPNDIRSAIIAGHPVSYGYSRVFQTLMDHPRIEVRIFPTMSEAERWILGGTRGSTSTPGRAQD